MFLASYLLGEPDLLGALFDVAGRLRGGVYVISELSERTTRQQLAELEEEADADAAVRAHKKNFAELTRHGVAVRGRADCHAKFLVVDDLAALVSSANLDTRGLNETGENGVMVTSPAEVDRVARFFTRLWDSCSYEMPAGSAEYSVRERPPGSSRCRVPVPDVTPAPGVIWTDGKEERLILAHLHDIIGRARRRLVLATFSLNGLVSRRELLIEPLTAALRNGEVAASLLCRGAWLRTWLRGRPADRVPAVSLVKCRFRSSVGMWRCRQERAVKPSAQPTLVRTQHLPPPAKTARWLRKRGPAGSVARGRGGLSACADCRVFRCSGLDELRVREARAPQLGA